MQSILARRRQFSTAHLYEQKAFTPEKNREVFGPCYSKHGHGHNYVLELFVQGPIDPSTGLVINVTDLDELMAAAVEPFDHKHISFDVPEFRDVIPTTENLTSYFLRVMSESLSVAHPHLKLNRIRLFETDDLWAVARANVPASKARGFQLTREIVLRSIHHLENPKWTPEENKAYYGLCYGTHGHDYHVQVTVGGAMTPSTGLTMDRDELDRILEREIRAPYDGVDLNKRFQVTSCEQLATEFFKLLKPSIPGLVKIGIQETRKNYFEFPPLAE